MTDWRLWNFYLATTCFVTILTYSIYILLVCLPVCLQWLSKQMFRACPFFLWQLTWHGPREGLRTSTINKVSRKKMSTNNFWKCANLIRKICKRFVNRKETQSALKVKNVKFGKYIFLRDCLKLKIFKT